LEDAGKLKDFIMNCSLIIKPVGGQLENTNNPRSKLKKFEGVLLPPIDNTTSDLTPTSQDDHLAAFAFLAAAFDAGSPSTHQGSPKTPTWQGGFTTLGASPHQGPSSTAPVDEGYHALLLGTFLASIDSDEGSTAMVESPSGSVVTWAQSSDSAEHGLFVNLSQDCPETDLGL
jgi:hypothetical protein